MIRSTGFDYTGGRHVQRLLSAGLFTLGTIYRKYHDVAVKEAFKEDDEENWAGRIGSESDRRS